MAKATEDKRRFRSVAVPLEVWSDLWSMANDNHRSPAQQIAFLVTLAKDFPTNKKTMEFYARHIIPTDLKSHE
jgi:hypothetical protein|tara:strand:+ start:611 stop:829 length:219 start_codon:yes stop_codon:yes gene_type:complete